MRSTGITTTHSGAASREHGWRCAASKDGVGLYHRWNIGGTDVIGASNRCLAKTAALGGRAATDALVADRC